MLAAAADPAEPGRLHADHPAQPAGLAGAVGQHAPGAVGELGPLRAPVVRVGRRQRRPPAQAGGGGVGQRGRDATHAAGRPPAALPATPTRRRWRRARSLRSFPAPPSPTRAVRPPRPPPLRRARPPFRPPVATPRSTSSSAAASQALTLADTALAAGDLGEYQRPGGAGLDVPEAGPDVVGRFALGHDGADHRGPDHDRSIVPDHLGGGSAPPARLARARSGGSAGAGPGAAVQGGHEQVDRLGQRGVGVALVVLERDSPRARPRIEAVKMRWATATCSGSSPKPARVARMGSARRAPRALYSGSPDAGEGVDGRRSPRMRAEVVAVDGGDGAERVAPAAAEGHPPDLLGSARRGRAGRSPGEGRRARRRGCTASSRGGRPTRPRG